MMNKTKGETIDDLGSIVADALNKKFKSNGIKAAYFLGEEDSPNNINEWVSSGSTVLDVAISNRKNGGFPVGRISEIAGLEQSGKSLMAAHIIANTQKAGGLAVYIDTENAAHQQFFEAIGVDTKKMVYAPMETIEDVFETIESTVEKIRSSDNKRLVTIIVDSVAGASTKIEMEKDFDKDGYATAKALIIGKAMRKISNMIGRERICLIFTNQLRQKLNAQPFSDPWLTPGGKGIPFHSSVRIRLSSVGAIKGTRNGKEEVIGSKVKAKIVKNKVGPPQRECEFETYFDSGIDDYSGWLAPLKDYGIVKTSGAWMTWVNKVTGEEVKFQTKTFSDLVLNVPSNREVIYDELCDNMIMKYTSLDSARIDDVVITNESIDDE
jgi:recombination protein RecA